jgi:ADP-ribose pyrophosphatase YjhB (NUDIX family)
MGAKELSICPNCGTQVIVPRNPVLTVDIIIEVHDLFGPRVVLIQRKNPPYGWALPGGFVDYGESVEEAARREAKEETNLDITLKRLFGVYSDPARDSRGHTASVVFVASGKGVPEARDDADGFALFARDSLPSVMAFDHARIMEDYVAQCEKSRP